MCSMRIAAAQDIDPAKLADIRVEAMKPSLEAVRRFDPVRAKERFLASYAPEDTRLILVDEVLAGFFVLRRRTDHLYIDHLYIRPQNQGSGMGRQIVQIVQGEARTARLPLRLIALKGSASNDFYVSCGFVLTGSDALDNEYVWHAAEVS